MNTVEFFLDFLDNIDVIQCKMIPNHWGEFNINNDKIFYKFVYSVVLRYKMSDICCNKEIDSSIVKELIIFDYNGELWYLDVNEVFTIEGDPWKLGNNVHLGNDKRLADTWNQYYQPIMASYNGKCKKLDSWKDFLVAYDKAIINILEL